MSIVTDLLTDIRSRLLDLDRPVISDLVHPGLSSEELERLFGPTPEAVRDWFSWCDGTRHRPGQTVGESAFIPGYIFPSAGEAAEIRRAGHADLDTMGQWLPILVNASVDLYAAIWQKDKFLGVAGVLESEPTEIEYATIEEMLRVHSTAYAEGAYFVDEGELEVDDDTFDRIFLQVTGRTPLF